MHFICVSLFSNPCLLAPVPTEGGAGRWVIRNVETFSETSKKYFDNKG